MRSLDRLTGFLCVATLVMAMNACSTVPEDDDDATSGSPTPTSPPETFEPELILDATSLDFGTLEIGGTSSLFLTLSNQGEADLEIDSVALEDEAHAAYFTFSPAPPYSDIVGGSSLEIMITFAPDEEGDFADRLQIVSNDRDSPQYVSLAASVISGMIDGDNDGYSTEEDCDDEDATAYPGADEVPYDDVDQDCDGEDLVDVDEDGYPAFEVGGDDCDDERADVFPSANETPYDGVDQDCDGFDLTDVDQDGFAALEAGGDDCNDGEPDINPNANDVPYDGVDQDCDGFDLTDVDGDTYAAEVVGGEDCDDEDINTYPGASEFADEKDNDCDGQVDEDLDTSDDDSDGYTEAQGDCDDYNETVFPGAIETPYDGVDQDCDGFDLTDVDVDGYPSSAVGGGDCDDDNPDVNPEAAETCNTLDDNCNGEVDEGVQITFYEDGDGDTFGNLEATVGACEVPGGYVTNADDCNDGDVAVNPAATEVCNGMDDDCDDGTETGGIDEGVTNTYFADTDGDSYGDLEATIEACDVPEGYVADATDCDDGAASSYPGAPELCNGVDDDCDCVGATDECVPDVDEGAQVTFYADVDEDGYGDPATTTLACEVPEGYVSDGTDCDDTAAGTHPDAEEVPYNGVDEDCSGYDVIDVDEDGYVAVEAGGDDCDDQSANTHPGASELDDDQDNDCDGEVDEELDTTDDDGDGFAETDGDCDDEDPARFPGADEVCNTYDDDCDGTVDEDVKLTFYRDEDEDGYGASSLTTLACTPPDDYVADATDCDDSSADVHPGANEVCNYGDDDCDGTVDEGVRNIYYRDTDGDGYGVSSLVVEDCETPSGYADQAGDCDDTRAEVNPGAEEVCNSVDDNCDAQIDEAVSTTYYRDGDSDGYGSSTSVTACEAPPGYVTETGDCDDTRANIHPDLAESCDGLDNNCSGEIDEGVTNTYYQDADRDGYGTVLEPTQACSIPGGYADTSTDCNDSNSTIYPGAEEQCNDVDDDCDTQVDEDVTISYYLDADGDSYGTPGTSEVTCSPSDGYVSNDDDCDDTDPDVNPGADEICDGIDNNCNNDIDGFDAVDGVIWYYDGDGDGYGSGAVSIKACEAPAGFVADSTDCDDRYLWGEEEVCDGLDNDCDGDADLVGGFPAIRVGYQPRNVVLGDWNGDGFVDAAAANWSGASVTVMFHSGGGSFIIRQQVSVGSNPADMLAADWDDDGDEDLIVSNYSSKSISVLANNGRGEFSIAMTVSLTFKPIGLTSGDWDGDGDIDLAVADYEGGGVAAVRNQAGSFLPGSVVSTGINPWGLAAGDWDLDGDLDVAVANSGSDTVSILQNSGSGSFTLLASSSVGGGPRRLAAADFDGDGITDLACNNYKTHSVSVLKGSGVGIFTPLSSLGVGSTPYAITALDFDNDGDQDLATTHYGSHTVGILRNSGTGTFVMIQSPGVGYQPWGITAADLDDDGDQDLAVTTYANSSPNGMVFIMRNHGGGDFTSFGEDHIAQTAYGLVTADFNDDGLEDYAVTAYTNHSVKVYLQEEDGTFSPYSTTTTYYYPLSLTVGDFDMDGSQDLAVACAHDRASIYVLLNDGTGVMTANEFSTVGRSWGITSGDWDKDGDLDLAYSNYYSNGSSQNRLVTMINDGSGQFDEGMQIQVGVYPYGVVSGDIDLDGDIDLACANNSSGSVSIVANDGEGSFTEIAEIATGTSPHNLVMANLNEDEFPDIAVTNYSQHVLSLLINDGTGYYQTPISISAGAQPFDVTAADIDDDGDLDLAVANLGQGTVTLVINNGYSSFTEAASTGLAGPGYFVRPIRLGPAEASDLGFVVSSYYTGNVTLLERSCE